MAAPADIRLYVSHLAQGKRDPYELGTILEWIRDNERGRAPLIREVGHFVHRERNQGLFFQRAADFVTCTTVMFTDHTIEALKDGFRACLRLAGEHEVKRLLKMPYRVAEFKLDGALSKLIAVDADDFVYKYPLKADEKQIIDLFLPYRTRIGDFNGQTIFRQFRAFLLAEKAISFRDTRAFDACNQFLSLFALARMNRRSVDLGNGDKGLLYIGNSEYHDGEYLTLKLEFYVNGMRYVREIMTTECRADEWAPDMAPVKIDIPSNPFLGSIIGEKTGAKRTFVFNGDGTLKPVIDDANN